MVNIQLFQIFWQGNWEMDGDKSQQLTCFSYELKQENHGRWSVNQEEW